jgi:hypothetical protein
MTVINKLGAINTKNINHILSKIRDNKMNKILLVFSIVLFTTDCISQISVDSLLTTIHSNFKQIGSKKYLKETFTIFESANKKDRYDLFLDSTNKLKEYIGLSIVHYNYDNLNRIKIIEGFNEKGIRSYWDFPSKQIFKYVSDSVVYEFNKIRNEICNCKNQDSLSNVVIIKEINSGSDSIYNKTRITISSIDSTYKLSYSICSNGEICKKPENVRFIFRQFDKNEKNIIVQERYYDRKLRLLNGKHSVYYTEYISNSPINKAYAYSVREISKNEIKVIRFYNKRGKLIDTKEYISTGPINVPY